MRYSVKLINLFLMKRITIILSLAAMLLMTAADLHAASGDVDSIPASQWKGKRVGVLGDSMSVPTTDPDKKRFYTYLAETLGIEPLVYARSGNKWKDLPAYAEKMYADHGDNLDAILIWAGTNDYNGSRPVGEYFTEREEEVNVNGEIVKRLHRTPVMSDSTFCGSINIVMSYLKENYPTKQIILLTPIHRAFAQFSPTNIQPDELYSNGQGLYIEDYVAILKKAGEVWSVPVIDLFSLSGLYPLYPAYHDYFQDAQTDKLHPDKDGHRRIAQTLQYQLLSLPVEF